MISEIIISLFLSLCLYYSLYLEMRELTRRFLLHCQLKFLPFNVYSIIDGNVLNPNRSVATTYITLTGVRRTCLMCGNLTG